MGHTSEALSTLEQSAWFYAKGKRKLGPFSWTEIRGLARNGQLQPADMVLRQGDKKWVTAASVTDLFTKASLPSAVDPAPTAVITSQVHPRTRQIRVALIIASVVTVVSILSFTLNRNIGVNPSQQADEKLQEIQSAENQTPIKKQPGTEDKERDAKKSEKPAKFSLITDQPSTKFPPPKFKNNLGMEFTLIPAGKSWLGGGGGKSGNKEMKNLNAFYLGVYEVTQEEWETVMGANPSFYKEVSGVSAADQKRFPVEQVSWDDVQLFLTKLNERNPQDNWSYRLPTEIEWEYACRGGPQTTEAESVFDFYVAKPTSQLMPNQANFEHPSVPRRTCKVGSYTPNKLGLYDMHGNVWEWCADNSPVDASEPALNAGKMQRGGSFANDTATCRAASRSMNGSKERWVTIGLRVALVCTNRDLIAKGPVQNEDHPKPQPPVNPKPLSPDEDDAKTEIAIAALGGNVVRNNTAEGKPIIAITISGQKMTDAGLEELADLKSLQQLTLYSTQVTNSGLKKVAKLRNLQRLDLTGTQVTDAGLEELAGLKNLEFLGLGFTKVTDAGLKVLPSLKSLQTLHLSATKVSDAGLTDLAGLVYLKRLHLDSTDVTDTGLKQLVGLKHLQFLRLDNTSITTTGVRNLKVAMPYCFVVHAAGDSGLKNDAEIEKRIAGLLSDPVNGELNRYLYQSLKGRLTPIEIEREIRLTDASCSTTGTSPAKMIENMKFLEKLLR